MVMIILAGTMASGCSLVPNMDHGTSGCSNARGIGPTGITEFDSNDPVFPAAIGRSPAEAKAMAAAAGHTVVFRVDIADFGECWCVPPPEGAVTEAWWTDKGALMLTVEGVDEGHTAENQPGAGWGC